MIGGFKFEMQSIEMVKFTHLTPEQRYKIDTLINAPNRLNQKETAQQVGISESAQRSSTRLDNYF